MGNRPVNRDVFLVPFGKHFQAKQKQTKETKVPEKQQKQGERASKSGKMPFC